MVAEMSSQIDHLARGRWTLTKLATSTPNTNCMIHAQVHAIGLLERLWLVWGQNHDAATAASIMMARAHRNEHGLRESVGLLPPTWGCVWLLIAVMIFFKNKVICMDFGFGATSCINWAMKDCEVIVALLPVVNAQVLIDSGRSTRSRYSSKRRWRAKQRYLKSWSCGENLSVIVVLY